MRIIRTILNQTVDVILWLVVLALLIWYMINPEKNFSTSLVIFLGYITFNIIMKVKMILNRKDICNSCEKPMIDKLDNTYFCVNPECDNYLKTIKK